MEMNDTAGGFFDYMLTRKRTKNMRIRVTGASKVVVCAPYHLPESRIRQFVADNSVKIQASLYKIDSRRRLYYPTEYRDGEDFWYLGGKTPIRVMAAKKASAVYCDGELILNVPETSGFGQRKTVFTRWAKRQAKAVFEERASGILPCFSGLLKQDIRISVKNMLSRWGSINTSRHTISLSVHLLRCEPELIDYIITHELCHLKCLNHSKAFYRELEKFFPDRKRLDKRLKEYGLVDFW